MAEREFKVGTFCKPGETRKSKVGAYTLWYSPDWSAGEEGCIKYTVSAINGTEAKKIAIAKRLEHEAGRAALAEDS